MTGSVRKTGRAERALDVLRGSVWSIGVAAVVGALIAALLLVVRSNDLALDVGVYHDATRAALDGRDVYGTTFGPMLPFAYPPTALLLLLWSALPTTVAAPLLFVASLACVVVCVRLLLNRGVRGAPAQRWFEPAAVAVVLLAMPVIQTLHFGQVNLLLAALVLTDLLVLRGSRWSGVLVGAAVATKLVPGLFVVWMLVTGRFLAVRNACLTVIALLAVTWAVFPQTVSAYLRTQAWDGSNNQPVDSVSNQAVTGAVTRMLEPSAAQTTLIVVVSVVLAVAGVAAAVLADRCGETTVAVCVVGLTAAAVSPLGWWHGYVWLPLLGVALLRSGLGRAREIGVALLVVAVFPPLLFASPDGTPLDRVLESGALLVTVAVLGWLLLTTTGSRSGVVEAAQARRPAP